MIFSSKEARTSKGNTQEIIVTVGRGTYTDHMPLLFWGIWVVLCLIFIGLLIATIAMVIIVVKKAKERQ